MKNDMRRFSSASSSEFSWIVKSGSHNTFLHTLARLCKIQLVCFARYMCLLNTQVVFGISIGFVWVGSTWTWIVCSIEMGILECTMQFSNIAPPGCHIDDSLCHSSCWFLLWLYHMDRNWGKYWTPWTFRRESRWWIGQVFIFLSEQAMKCFPWRRIYYYFAYI